MACQFHDCIIVVDLRKLEHRENITYDSWFWKNDKSYIVPGNKNELSKNAMVKNNIG